MDAQSVDDARPQVQVRRAALASVIGTTIEWYDFFLYGTTAALVFGHAFFPERNPTVGTLAAFATFFVGFIARPIGAAIFGHFGDRIGRKATLIATLLVMGIATFLIGLTPTYGTIGVWGAVILTILRVFQGIGVGGEWGGSVLLAMEWGSRRRRGLMGSWAQMGVPVGLFLSTVVFSITLALTGDNFQSWGWRIPFLLSVVLIGVGLFVRLKIVETPAFSRVLESRQTARMPVAEVLKSNWREVILSALIRMAEQAPFYIFTSFVLAYGTQHLKLDEQFLTNSVTFAALVSCFTVPLYGWLSDKIGRKRMYMIGAFGILIYSFIYIALLNTAVPALVGLAIVISIQPHDMLYGPQAAFIAESFSTRLRYSGASLGYQLASIIAGGPAPLIAGALLAATGSGYAIAAYIAFTAVVTIVATSMMKDRTGVDIEVEQTAAPRAGGEEGAPSRA
ncbi:MAG: MHS family MFS transporter [Rubrobacteraceae bacterium]|uniref:MFS transporter n=1 Tax=Rubrobacter naiadicus TaxID=1392641 RepID=UPI002360C2B3|nr:MFS transporter [Rubrobacter naiadicus]MCL6438797.1 MHS family MFS transporter [Rubrobacteraceae bacterium]